MVLVAAVAGDTPEEVPVVCGQRGFRYAGLVEEIEIPGCFPLLYGVPAGIARRSDRHDDQLFETFRYIGGHDPGQPGPEVMADQPGPFYAQPVHDADNVTGKQFDAVVLHAFRTACIAEPALVRDDDTVAGVGNCLNLVAPDLAGIREAVQEHDVRPLSVHGYRELQVIDGQGPGVRRHVKRLYYLPFRRAGLAAQQDNYCADDEFTGVMDAYRHRCAYGFMSGDHDKL